jgi:hypothetical protein
MYFFKAAGLLALKEPTDVLTKINKEKYLFLICLSQTTLFL